MTRTAKLLLVPVVLLQIVLFTFVVQHRFIHVDEGFFLLASRLVLMHKKPYLDFFYPQAPLLPYIYALWMKCFGISWAAGRLLAAVLTTLLGALLYEHVCRLTRNWLAGLAAVVVFVSSTLVFAWFPIVGPFSLAALFIFSTYVIVSRLSAESSHWLIGAAGLLLGLSVDIRSYLLLLIPLFVWWIFQTCNTRTRLASILWFLGGFSIAMVPSLYLFLSSPDAFLFNNLGYHAIRSSEGLIGMWQEKLVLAVMFFFGGPGANGIQNSILFFVSLGFVFSMPGRKYPPRLAFQIAVVVGILSLLPTPAYLPYFCLAVPFLIVSAVCVVNDLLVSSELRQQRLLAAVACVALLGVYVGASARDVQRYFQTGEGIPGVRWARDKGDWRLQRILEVSQAIDQIASPGEMVASFWPGDVFQTTGTSFRGFENPFALAVSEKLTAQQRARYHILSPADIESDFAVHTPRIVVLRDQVFSAVPTAEELRRLQGSMDAFKSSLRDNGYTLVRSIGGISIYVYSSKS
jgi:4-amino-4-deoxy-L-arabinose transferase-like glycosyltransferase